MDIEQIRNSVLKMENVTEGFPFGEDTLVFKVMGKIFLLAALDSIPLRINIKCDPEDAINLRDEYDGRVLPGYHMNKKHWNTVIIDGTISDRILSEWITESYNLVRTKKK